MSNMSEVEQVIKQEESRQEKDDHTASSPVNEREYILRGHGIALMVQLFCIQEQYEMRSVAAYAWILAALFLYPVHRSVDLLPGVFQLFPVSWNAFLSIKH